MYIDKATKWDISSFFAGSVYLCVMHRSRCSPLLVQRIGDTYALLARV